MYMMNCFLILGLFIIISVFIYCYLKLCHEKFQKIFDYSKKGKVQYVRKPPANTYIKKDKSNDGYEAEKYSYIRLRNIEHFPSLLENGCRKEGFTEIHVVLLWETNNQKKRRTQNIISNFPSLKILKIKNTERKPHTARLHSLC